MRIVIAGAGEVGTHLAKMLSNEQHDIVIIDPEESRLKPINSSLDVMTRLGSATSLNLLKDTLGKKTDLFIAVAHLEDTNITAAILAKRLGAVKTIARIDNREYLEHTTREFFKSLGIDSLIYPELIAAKQVLGLLHETGTTEFMEFSGGMLSLYVQKLEKNAPVVNKTLREVTFELKNITNNRTVAIKRNDDTIIPRGDEVFKEGDLVFVVSTKEGIKEMMKFTGKENFIAKRIMILGGSRIGRRVAQSLQKKCFIKLIDYDVAKCEELADNLENTLVIQGDGRNANLLIQEGISQKDVFVAVTGNSETNILACLLATKLGVKKTIAEVENVEYINLAENSGIDTIINKKLAAASRIFRHTTNPNVTQVKCMTGTDAEVFEYRVPENSKIVKGKLRDIHFPKGAIIGGGTRDGKPFIATGDTVIKPNDKVMVFTLPHAIEKMSKFFL
ncbi:MAG TPA: Trk system potassium transporter TrkA [Bacteroidales bacterium]|nr:Trk system potassium transporter TrkA [Bacteroidales bacterium]